MARKPTPSRGPLAERTPIKAPPDPGDTNKHTPRFCLRHLQPGFDVDALTLSQRADLATALAKRSRMLWQDIIRADRHGLGLETLPSKAIKPDLPTQFRDQLKFMVLRYSGRLPMVGVRTADTFHIVWIEAEYGQVYDHGG